MAEATSDHHELIRVFAEHGFALNKTLTEMLSEHFSHSTERRGCGYTQATRHLADFINRPRDRYQFDDFDLFQPGTADRLKDLMARFGQRTDRSLSWRHLDRQLPLLKPLLREDDTELRRDLQELANQILNLRRLPTQLKLEESRLLAGLIINIILPQMSSTGPAYLNSYPETLQIGTCTLAEKFFLELAHQQCSRKARMNIIVDDDRQPLLLEKVNLGDALSCLALVPVLINGVTLPPGTLIGVAHNDPISGEDHQGPVPGQSIRADQCQGFRYLRLTTLAVSPASRARTFTTQYANQREKIFYDPENTVIENFIQLVRQSRQPSPSIQRRSSLSSLRRVTRTNRQAAR